MPFIDKNRYKIFSWSKEVIINNEECKRKIKKLEEFREFIWGTNMPPLLFPIFILSAMMGGILCWITNDFDSIKEYALRLSLVNYFLISLIYYLKLKKAINCTKNK